MYVCRFVSWEATSGVARVSLLCLAFGRCASVSAVRAGGGAAREPSAQTRVVEDESALQSCQHFARFKQFQAKEHLGSGLTGE
jgi:hypothetical protein